MRIAIVTDAWAPQANGVVRTLTKTIEILESWGHTVRCINPSEFRTFPLPTYPDIRLPIAPARKLRRSLEAFRPEAIHISTEGTLGWAARAYCLKRKLPYTSAYHTKFPEYVSLRIPVPVGWGYAVMRRFHGPAVRTMVATQTIEDELKARGFGHISRWARGVDLERFKPDSEKHVQAEGPIFMYVGRVAVEKNIEAFLKLDLPGSKVVVGGGPALQALQDKYPQAQFLGHKEHHEVGQLLPSAAAMVFPSLTDTFGLVMLEANGCGVPVAAFPVPGPLDVIKEGVNGCLNEDLRQAALDAIQLDRGRCRVHAEGQSWDACTKQFFDNLAPF